jgi:hypothetical protein
VKRLLVALLGRPLRCRRCGRIIVRAVVLPWRGRIVLAGAERATLRVRWEREDVLGFEHVDLELCERP